MKKAISILLVCALVFCSVLAFAGCSKQGDNKHELVLITDGASVTDGAYNESAWNGVKAYGEENNMSYRYYQPALSDDGTLSVETIAKYIDISVNNGAKTIVLPGEDFAVAAYEIAPTYKDVNFILVDALPHAQGETSLRTVSNVMCVRFDVLEAGFLAGYTAVLDGNRELGYIGSIKNDDSGNYGAGFVQGAAFAADQMGVPVLLDYAEYDSPLLTYDYSFTVKAVYEEVAASTEDELFKVNVVDGYGTGTYALGENVTIAAIDAPEGKVFDHWDVKSDTEGVKDSKVNISSKKDSVMNLLVEKCDCTITAVWADAQTYPVTVNNADGSVYKTYNVTANNSVWVDAPPAENQMVFDYWQVSDENAVSDTKSAGTSVKVAQSGVTLTPVYKVSDVPTFNVTVENGTGSGSYVTGDIVSLRCDVPEEGYMFSHWENIDAQGLSTGIAIENEYNYSTSFVMVDRFASIAETMYDKGVSIIFGGGNPHSDSIFNATTSFDYQTWGFGSGIDQKSMKNCYASVVNDYGAAVELCLGNFVGGQIVSANTSNNCIYVTGKSLEEKVTDKDGNKVNNEAYDANYAQIYNALADDTLKPVNVQAGAIGRLPLNSKCFTLNYWSIILE